MNLSEYKNKRDFNKTPEPDGSHSKTININFFVVQKHKARRLHYDFRLLHKGVLLSWAIPKGFSYDPNIKHLAAKVENHPINYANFEGTIPEGNYGAGTVMVWDHGTYFYHGARNEKDIANKVEAGLKKGGLSLELNGKKLKGGFIIAKLNKSDKDEWIFYKKKDEKARNGNIKFDENSVLSGKTIEQIKNNPDKDWTRRSKIDLSRFPKEPMPEKLMPMLAFSSEKAFDSSDWLFEIKWDGYRALTFVGTNKVSIYSRNNLEMNNQFPHLAESLAKVEEKVIFDGEIVAIDDNGKPNFQLLQNLKTADQNKVIYYIFDLLYLNDHNLMGSPLIERKQILKKILPESPSFKFCDHIENKGKRFYELIIQSGLEGMLAKRKDSIYYPGKRTKNWLKIKPQKTKEAIIGGYTFPEGSRSYFGALLLGQYDNNFKLNYIGSVGTGFSEELLKDLYQKMKKLKTNINSFASIPKTLIKKSYWIKPELICEVKYTGITDEGYLRHPSFLRLRRDIDYSMISSDLKESSQINNLKTDEKVINNHKIKISHPEKIYWPEKKLTKKDLINYYDKIADYILPYLIERPQSLNRFPDGIYGQHFYQKNIEPENIKLPSWAKTICIDGTTNYLLCQNKETLIFMANLGCIEFNPWNSKINNLENPDFCVIDLDPVEIEFKYVVEAAMAVHSILDKYQIKSYCKTSGATGLHIYIPLGGKYTYDQSKEFARIIAILANKTVPKFTSVERLTERRVGKVYLDFLQNNRGQTLVSAYSLRPRRDATVSTPLEWSEVNESLDPKNFNIDNIFERIKDKGDLFLPVLQKGIDLKKILREMGNVIS